MFRILAWLHIYIYIYILSWSSPTLSEKEGVIKVPKEEDKKKLETAERVENNVWWPWKNYDDWLNGRGQPKTEQPAIKNKGKKTRKEKKKNHKKHNRKNGKKRKNRKPGKKHHKPGGDRDPRLLSINGAVEDNEITKKGSIPEIQYNASPIDIILRNNSLVPNLVKYSSRNYTYGMSYKTIRIITS